MLTNRERLALLAKRVQRAELVLQFWRERPATEGEELGPIPGALGIQLAEEALAETETLLLLEQERQAALAVILTAFPGTTNVSAETPVRMPPLLTRNAGKS
jgi:hypothetical protein